MLELISILIIKNPAHKILVIKKFLPKNEEINKLKVNYERILSTT